MDWMDLVSIIGYPLVGWLSWRAGKLDGIETTIAVLHEQGLIELDEEQ